MVGMGWFGKVWDDWYGMVWEDIEMGHVGWYAKDFLN